MRMFATMKLGNNANAPLAVSVALKIVAFVAMNIAKNVRRFRTSAVNLSLTKFVQTSRLTSRNNMPVPKINGLPWVRESPSIRSHELGLNSGIRGIAMSHWIQHWFFWKMEKSNCKFKEKRLLNTEFCGFLIQFNV